MVVRSNSLHSEPKSTRKKMNYFFRVFLILGLVSAARAHQFIKLIILAGLGLAGLWMVHTLAQDYNRIQNGMKVGGKFFGKRSISHNQPKINWELVLSRDPASCARSFICQLASQETSDLDLTERTILKLTRLTAVNDEVNWANSQLLEALKYGEQAQDPSECRKLYKLCPYSSKTMASLIRLLER